MICKKCGSENVNAQIVTESSIVPKRRSIIWWILVGFWWIPIKWLVFTLPAVILKIFGGGRKKIKTTSRTVFVCSNCGHSWG